MVCNFHSIRHRPTTNLLQKASKQWCFCPFALRELLQRGDGVYAERKKFTSKPVWRKIPPTHYEAIDKIIYVYF